MYRQIALSKESKDYHRLLWRFSAEEKISHLRLKRVIYRVRSSAYHATRALQATATFKPGSVANSIPLRKWTSNDIRLIGRLTEDFRETKELVDLDNDEKTMKTFGLSGTPRRIKSNSNTKEPTKNLLASGFYSRKLLWSMTHCRG